MIDEFAKDLKLDVRIGERRRKFNLVDELRITVDNPVELSEQMAQQPSKYAWVAVLYALASDHYERLKRRHKVLSAQLDKHHRKHRDDKALKITEAIITADIEADGQYIKSGDDLQNAKLNRDLLDAAVEAFEQRKDMMISIGSNLRQEREGELRILQSKARKITTKGTTRKSKE